MSLSRTTSALASLAVGAVLVSSAFTVPSAEAADRPSDRIAAMTGGAEPHERMAIGECSTACENTAKTCVKKCVVEQKPCMDKCNIDDRANPKYLKAGDQACLKSCFDKSRPCQQHCQATRASCARSCSN